MGEEEELLQIVPEPLFAVGRRIGLASGTANGPEQVKRVPEFGTLAAQAFGELRGGFLSETGGPGEKALEADVLRPRQVGGQDVPGQAAFEPGEIEEEGFAIPHQGVVYEARFATDEKDIARVKVAMHQGGDAPDATAFQDLREQGKGIGDGRPRSDEGTGFECQFGKPLQQAVPVFEGTEFDQPAFEAPPRPVLHGPSHLSYISTALRDDFKAKVVVIVLRHKAVAPPGKASALQCDDPVE